MASSFSASTRLSGHDRANFQINYYQDTDTNTPVDYLGEDLLADATSTTQPVIPTPILPHLDVTGVRVLKPAIGDSDDTRLIISFDYGTTFTGVAFALTPNDVEMVLNYGKLMNNSHKIPSIISFSPAPNGERQWGADISPAANIHIHDKIRLDVQRRKIDGLESTLEVLEGTGNLSIDHVKWSNKDPAYLYKAPISIVTDYLTKVFEYAWKTIEPRYLYGTEKPPVDVVVTVPAGWSYQATNATLKALRNAGVNDNKIPTLKDMILLTEPEAASHFTVRHLLKRTPKFLKPNEPFILVDAGGGTVDVISYQAKQLEPHLDLVQVSEPTKDKCGAAYINTHFKRWLSNVIGEERYAKFDPSHSGLRVGIHTTESSGMRRLIEQFDEKKKRFSNSSGPIKLDLPGSLSKLSIDGVIKNGELTLQPGDMKAMFNECVTKIIPLIRDQKRLTEKLCKRRVKNLLLVGGFGESPYLREQLETTLNLREMKLQTPEHTASWTAVVQGGVIYGVGKANHRKLKIMKTSQRSYGVVVDEIWSHGYDEDDWYKDPLTATAMARGQFTWMIRKGDLMLSDKTEVAEKEFTRTFKASDDRNFDLPIYTYSEEDDDVPPRWEIGQYEVEVVGILRCNITPDVRKKLQPRKNHDSGETYDFAHLTCKMRTSFTSLEVEVFVDKISIGCIAIPIGGQELPESSQTQEAQRASISSPDSYI